MAKEGYSTISEYFRELVRQDQKRKASDRLETLLLEGLESGTATPMTEEDWQDIRSKVRQRTKENPPYPPLKGGKFTIIN